MSSFEVLPFYRGVSVRYPIDAPSLNIPRRNREPRSSSPSFHRAADAWFEKTFGIPYRTQGLFVTPSDYVARNYAASDEHVMRIVPLSPYRFCWSPTISDLLFVAQRLAEASSHEIEEYLAAADYQEGGLQAAHTSNHEVMLHCERYVAIPIGLMNGGARPQTSLILP